MRIVGRLRRDQRGSTAIEYALVASLIAVAAIVGFRQLGGNVDNKFVSVANKIG